MAINYRSDEEIGTIRKANQIVVSALNRLEQIVKPGITTRRMDREAESVIRDLGARPSFKGYRGFPCALCVAINDQVVHGIPDDTKLEEGDIIGVDLGAEYKGYYGDSARTLPVGEISDSAERLLATTRNALMSGIEKARPGGHLSDISHAIQAYVEDNGYSVVRAFVGHGIGTKPHEDPQIPNFGAPGRGPKLRKGMVLAIEPMVNVGSYAVKILDDKWTVKTADGGLSAHFEHSIAIVDDGYSILSEF